MGVRIEFLLFVVALYPVAVISQVPIDLKSFDKKGEASISIEDEILEVTWPSGEHETGKVYFNLKRDQPLFNKIELIKEENISEIASNLEPVFLLSVGERDLEKRNGWNIFFDQTAYKPYETHLVNLEKREVRVISEGSRTKISISEVRAGEFNGSLEITLFNGSPLLNIAVVIATERDSRAIIYDAGLSGSADHWEEVFWANTDGYLQNAKVDSETKGKNLAVKYRTVIGQTKQGSLAVFPPPHQYFYPLDNAYNLKYTWYGKDYSGKVSEFGIGIRHEMLGDRRHVPWFNAPPGTRQRLNFFILISNEKDGKVLS
ncbi:hypothetical protein [Salegentibacter sp. Hel_I_6]|uniref:hypothetical protein n=1 Tax=Salegentibacter sp. Hel_I_6 TaxID=1250278 RepID=UPI000B2DCB75|nr:hypothetical protein [Salegentibacter sp. Hel_I_6]